MCEVTYARNDIARKAATGFMLGSLVLSLAGFVIFVSTAAFGVEPFSTKRVRVTIAGVPVVLLCWGIVLGWIVRLGLHACWQHRRNPQVLQVTWPDRQSQR